MQTHRTFIVTATKQHDSSVNDLTNVNAHELSARQVNVYCTFWSSLISTRDGEWPMLPRPPPPPPLAPAAADEPCALEGSAFGAGAGGPSRLPPEVLVAAVAVGGLALALADCEGLAPGAGGAEAEAEEDGMPRR